MNSFRLTLYLFIYNEQLLRLAAHSLQHDYGGAVNIVNAVFVFIVIVHQLPRLRLIRLLATVDGGGSLTFILPLPRLRSACCCCLAVVVFIILIHTLLALSSRCYSQHHLLYQPHRIIRIADDDDVVGSSSGSGCLWLGVLSIVDAPDDNIIVGNNVLVSTRRQPQAMAAASLPHHHHCRRYEYEYCLWLGVLVTRPSLLLVVGGVARVGRR